MEFLHPSTTHELMLFTRDGTLGPGDKKMLQKKLLHKTSLIDIASDESQILDEIIDYSLVTHRGKLWGSFTNYVGVPVNTANLSQGMINTAIPCPENKKEELEEWISRFDLRQETVAFITHKLIQILATCNTVTDLQETLSDAINIHNWLAADAYAGSFTLGLGQLEELKAHLQEARERHQEYIFLCNILKL